MATIQIRRDTAANWTSQDPTLAAGEKGRETDTGKEKTGDGTTEWSGLSYDDLGLTIGDNAEYGYLRLSEDQTTGLTSGDPIKFDTITGNIAFNPSTYRVTLKSGHTYEFQYTFLATFSSGTAYLNVQPYDVTNSAYLVESNRCSSIPTTYSGGNSSPTSTGLAVVTPSSDIEVEFRIQDALALTNINYVYAAAMVKRLGMNGGTFQRDTFVNEAYHGSTQAFSASAWTTVVFDTESREVANGVDYNNSTGIFTCQRAGSYRFRAQLGIQPASASKVSYCRIEVNSGGGYSVVAYGGANSVVGPEDIYPVADKVLSLLAGDLVKVTVFSTNTSPTILAGDGQSWCQVTEERAGSSQGADNTIEHVFDGTTDSVTFDVSGMSEDISKLEIEALLKSAYSSTNEAICVRFNSDTGSNYDSVYAEQNASSTTGGCGIDGAGVTFGIAGYCPGATGQTNSMSSFNLRIPYFRETTGFKGFTSDGGFVAASSPTDATIWVTKTWGQWRSLNAITSVTIYSYNSANLTGKIKVRGV